MIAQNQQQQQQETLSLGILHRQRPMSSGRDDNNNSHHNDYNNSTNDTTTSSRYRNERNTNNDSSNKSNNKHVASINNDDDNDEYNENNNDDENDDDDEYLVSCRCESAKVISTLLSCLRHVAVSSSSSVGNRNNTTTTTANHNSTMLSSSNSTQNGNGNSYSVRSQRRNSATTASASGVSTLQPVTVYCSPTNMTFHICGTSKQIQASVDISSQLFSDYSVATSTTTTTTTSSTSSDNNNNDNTSQSNTAVVGGEFCINLVTLLECLHCLGTQNLDTTKLCFSYNTTQELFKLELLEESSGILSTASIPGMLSPDQYDSPCINDIDGQPQQRLYTLAHAFRQSEIYARMIIQSESLYDLISELDYVAGATMATVTVNNNTSELMISAIGYLGECQIALPTRGNHIISMEVTETDRTTSASTTGTMTPSSPNAWTYPLHSLMESMRGLEIADETCITINTAGMMAIQHQVVQQQSSSSSDYHRNSNVATTPTPSFVDFILCCMVEEEDDDDDDDNNTTDSPIHAQNADTAATSIPTTASLTRARIVSQTKQQPNNNHRHNDSDENDDDDDNEQYSTRSHNMSAHGARLFGSLVMSADNDDDNDNDNEDKLLDVDATMAAATDNGIVNGGRRQRRRPVVKESTAAVSTVSTRPRRSLDPNNTKNKKSRIDKAPVAVSKSATTATRNKIQLRGGRGGGKETTGDDFNDSNDDSDDEDDMEVSISLSGGRVASSSSSAVVAESSVARIRRRSNHHRATTTTTRRRINDDDDDDDNDGSSSPELVYGQQH